MKQYVLTPNQLKVISATEDAVETPVTQLAVRTHLLPDEARRAVARLAGKGLVKTVTRSTSAGEPGADATSTMVGLTSAGRYVRNLITARAPGENGIPAPSGSDWPVSGSTVISSGGSPAWFGLGSRAQDVVLVLPGEEEPDHRDIGELEAAIDQALADSERRPVS